MGTITNTIKTQFVTEGANNVIKDTENLGRAQTRLGNASTGNSRQFAAQSKGLGGLVAAYAGAAATTFALQAAFDALSKAAASENIVKGTSALASQIGQNGPLLLKNIQDITQGQLTLADAAENANLALSGGFNTKQIESLTKVASSASQALGRDLSDSYTRLVKGAAKLEPELLDELGIFTRIDPAVNAYAKSMNVSASSLTNFERRQAFANAVIEEGARKFSAIDVSAPSAQKSLNRLEASISSLGTSFLQTVANALKPFVDFINNNMGVTLLAFAAIMKVVLAKTGQEMAGWVSGQLGQLATWSTSLAQKAEQAKGTMDNLGAASKKFEADVKARGGLFGTVDDGAGGKKRGTGSFTQPGAKVTMEENQLASAARQRFREGGAPIGPQREADIAALTAIQKKYATVTNEATRATLLQSTAFKDATFILEQYGIAQSQATLKTRLLTAASGMLQVAAKGLTAAFGMLMSALNYVFLAITAAQLIGSLFDVDILAEIKGYFVDLSQKAEDMKQGFVGLSIAAAGGADKLTQALKRVGASDEDLEGVSDKLRDIGASIDDYAKKYRTVAAGRGGSNANRAVTDADRLLGIQKEIQAQNAIVSGGTGMFTSEKDIEQARQQVVLLENAKQALQEYGIVLTPVINQISRSSGLGVDVLGKLFGTEGSSLTKFDKVTNIMTIFGKEVDISSGNINDLDKNTRDIIDSGTLLANVLDEADKAFYSGNTSSEKLSQQLAGARDQFQNLRKAMVSTPQDAAAIAQKMDEAAQKIRALTKAVRDLKTIEDVLSGIQSTFSGQIGAVDKAAFSGFVSMSGQLAKNSNEAKNNQIAYLGAAVKAASALQSDNDRMGAATHNDAIRATAIEAGAAASKALTGQLLEQMQITQQIIADETQKSIELKNQLKILKMQSDIAVASARFQLTQTQTTNTINAAEHQLELSKVGLTNLQATHSLEQQRIKNNNDLLDITAEIANIQGSGNAAADAAALKAIKNQTRLNDLQRLLITMERDVTASKAEIETRKRANIELEKQVVIDNYEMQKKAIESSGGANAAATKMQIDSLNRQAELLVKQKGDKMLENDLAMVQFDKETAIIRAKIQADIAKADNDSKTIEATRLLDLARVDADEASNTAQNKAILAQLDGFDSFATSIVSLIGGIDVFARTVAELVGVYDKTGTAKAAVLDTVKNLPQTAVADTSAARGLLADNMQLQTNSYKAQRGQINEVAVLNQQNYRATRQGLVDSLAYTDNLRAAQRTGLETQQKAAIEEIVHNLKMIDLQKTKAELEGKAGGSNTAAQLAQLKAQLEQDLAGLGYSMQDLDFETNILAQTMLAVKDNIRSGIVSGLNDLNNSLFETTDETKSFGERLRDIFYKIMLSIEQTVFERTIANPIGDIIADWSGKLMGKLIPSAATSVVGDTAGATAVAGLGTTVSTASTGAVTAINAAAASLGGALSNLGVSVGGSAQGAGAQAQAGGAAGSAAITGSGTALAGATQTSSGVVAQANTAGATTLMSSLGPILAVLAVIAAIVAIFGGKKGGGSKSNSAAEERARALAQSNTNTFGSVPQMASGGMMRDRVPALLEPGEFVIRKPMAKRIGASNLAQMNATGKTTNSAPVINIKNEGSPKNAEAAQPRFDGEKYVIDIIMRDLSNNGPIRRSLRGGV